MSASTALPAGALVPTSKMYIPDGGVTGAACRPRKLGGIQSYAKESRNQSKADKAYAGRKLSIQATQLSLSSLSILTWRQAVVPCQPHTAVRLQALLGCNIPLLHYLAKREMRYMSSKALFLRG